MGPPGQSLQQSTDETPTGATVGTVLGQRYRLSRRIATGGMGEVWVATDTVLEREVAVKLLKNELVDHGDFLERFRAEARHTAALTHPGIAGVFDYGEQLDDGHCTAYFVMELVMGEPLSDVLARQGALPLSTALAVLVQSADALHAAHRLGVVHRDVKPGNLLLTDNGTIKVTDFGIARAINSVPLTEAGQTIGTSHYMSPEQAVGADATPASDVYSLGLIGYEMLAGQRPFNADNPVALALAHVQQLPPPLPSTVPESVRAAIEQALSKDPADRPLDASAFADQLRQLQAELAESAENEALLPPTQTALLLASDEGEFATQVMTPDGTDPATAIMPTGGIAVAAPRIVVSEVDDSRGRRPWLWLVGVVATIAVLAFASVQRGKGISPADTPTGSSVPATVAAASSQISVTQSDFVGLAGSDVALWLSTLGLLVQESPVDAAGVPAGVVVAVEPEGMLERGSTVILSVSTGNGQDGGNGKDKNPGNGNG